MIFENVMVRAYIYMNTYVLMRHYQVYKCSYMFWFKLPMVCLRKLLFNSIHDVLMIMNTV